MVVAQSCRNKKVAFLLAEQLLFLEFLCISLRLTAVIFFLFKKKTPVFSLPRPSRVRKPSSRATPTDGAGERGRHSGGSGFGLVAAAEARRRRRREEEEEDMVVVVVLQHFFISFCLCGCPKPPLPRSQFCSSLPYYWSYGRGTYAKRKTMSFPVHFR